MTKKTYICIECNKDYPCIVTIYDELAMMIKKPKVCILHKGNEDDVKHKWLLQKHREKIIKAIKPLNILDL